jgi:hypothetical protein
VSQVEIISEQPVARGLAFELQVLADDGALRRHRLLLSWADYNVWSHDGGDSPAAVAQAVVLFWLHHQRELPESLDASVVRRRFASSAATGRSVDDDIRALIAPG